MADNVAITAGAGTTIATDDDGTAHHQYVKIEFGADGTFTKTSTTNPLPVIDQTVFAEDAGHTTADKGNFVLAVANEAGTSLSNTDLDYTPFSTDRRGRLDVNISSRRTFFEIDIPGVTNALYAAAEQFGTIITITNAARYSGGTGVLDSIVYYDDDNVQGAVDFMFFDSTVTLAADNATYAVSDADNRKALGAPVSMTYFNSSTNNRIGSLKNLGFDYVCTGGTSLFCAVITRTTPTPATGATGGHRLRFGMSRD